MLEIIKNIIRSAQSNEEKLHLTREFLQNVILKILSENNGFLSMAFIGGTALRILFGVKRYSEDLDFSLHDKSKYDFIKILEKIKKELELMNFQVELKYKQKTVDSCFISFSNLLYLLGISMIPSQKLSIKLEIDTNPPSGYFMQTTILKNEFMFSVKHYDLPSLMAGKLHAVFCRKFVKGRDYYDLFWYLQQKVKPNFVLFNNALQQTEKKFIVVNELNWKKLLLEKLEKVDFKYIQNDIENFLIYSAEKRLLCLEEFKKLI